MKASPLWNITVIPNLLFYKRNILLLLIISGSVLHGQITHSETVTIEPTVYGPKLILNDANTANKVPMEFRANDVIKWEFGMRPASDQNDLAIWRFYSGAYHYVMWFNREDGKVGVGTAQPLANLHISSETEGDATLLLESDTDNNNENDNTMFKMRQDGSQVGVNMGFSETDFGSNIFGIGTRYANIEKWNAFVINTQNGRVGIGTKVPDSELTVKGTIHAEEVKVDLSVPGPDYVFKEGYDLKSLEEVQKYIQANGHLPNMPSAREMEENGVRLGEMNMKLLEKIEELTLYLLEQQKVLQNKESRIQHLEEELATIQAQPSNYNKS